MILAWTLAEEVASSSSSEVTKLEVVDLGVVDGQSDSKGSLQLQRKRDSGYVYNRPDRLSGGQRFRGQSQRPILNGYRAKILSRYPSQSQRPFTSYGAPVSRPSSQYSNPQIGGLGSHQNQFKAHQNHHGQFSNHFNKPGGGLFNQEVPSPVRHVDFVEPNPIASQNDVPFGQNTANYLPPRNQELPSYSVPSNFAFNQQSFQQQQHSQGSRENFESQGHGQSLNHEISDAANFLAQNAQAISQLYGAPATDQSFAPNNEEFSGSQGGQIQSVTGPQQNNQHFSGQLPSYASGTLEPEESLERIQSKEKDRLIAQLQTLLSQSRSQNAASAELIGQYAQSHGNYIENQNLLASISNQIRDQHRYENQNTNNPNPFGSDNSAFGQAPFTPGTSTNPTFTLGYGITTQQTPTSTTTTTTTTPKAPILPSQGPSQDGSSQTGTSLPPPPPPPPNFPQYGGFVPSLIGGNSFPSGVPSYGTFVPASPQQPAGSSPTHFGIPIPQNPNAPQQPQNPGASAQPPAQNPVLRPIGLPQPVQPVHSIHPITPLAPLPPAVTPLHPISTSLHGFQQFHGIAAPVQPVHPPVHPILPVAPALTPVPVHPAPVASQPAYGVQSAVLNPLLYKPVKAVYPIYYYPNLQYQVQKPALPSYPWSYAPSYPQAKPAQIWK